MARWTQVTYSEPPRCAVQLEASQRPSLCCVRNSAFAMRSRYVVQVSRLWAASVSARARAMPRSGWQPNPPVAGMGRSTGSSPLLYKDLVVFVHDQNQADSVCVALDKHTGKLVWQRPRKKAMTWKFDQIQLPSDMELLVAISFAPGA